MLRRVSEPGIRSSEAARMVTLPGSRGGKGTAWEYMKGYVSGRANSDGLTAQILRVGSAWGQPYHVRPMLGTYPAWYPIFGGSQP